MDTTNRPNSDLSQGDDHGGISPPSEATRRRGYEEDVYDSKTVLSVPLLVVLFFVLAFATVTVIFNFIAYPASSGRSHPGAAARNNESLNKRLSRIDRALADPKTGDAEPRLEPLRLRSGDARAITRPELPEGNSPELHPEDLIPSKERFPALYGGGAGKLGIDKTLGLGNDALKALFPASGPPLPADASRHVATNSNAGRGADESVVIPPQLPKQAEPKAEEKKQPEKKDNPTPAPAPSPKGGKQ